MPVPSQCCSKSIASASTGPKCRTATSRTTKRPETARRSAPRPRRRGPAWAEPGAGTARRPRRPRARAIAPVGGENSAYQRSDPVNVTCVSDSGSPAAGEDAVQVRQRHGPARFRPDRPARSRGRGASARSRRRGSGPRPVRRRRVRPRCSARRRAPVRAAKSGCRGSARPRASTSVRPRGDPSPRSRRSPSPPSPNRPRLRNRRRLLPRSAARER